MKIIIYPVKMIECKYKPNVKLYQIYAKDQQGGNYESGAGDKVYPYPLIEKIFDTAEDKEYQVVFLENQYLKVMILPEFGGRIQITYDKTNGYDFVYHNHMIKSAFAGLFGL